MSSPTKWEHLVVQPAEDVPFFTPKQVQIAGTPLAPDPPRLFQPIRIRGLQLQNRILVSPMAQFSAQDGHATPWHMQHLGSLAVRGPGLTWTEACAVSEFGRTSPYDAGMWKDSHVEAWKPITEFFRSQGQLIGIQLIHGGRKGSMAVPYLSKGELQPEKAGGFPSKVIAASDLRWGDQFALPKAMSLEDIREVVDAFGSSAERAVRAGFNAINIHAAHGFLVHSFLSSVSNKRTDQYGGSFENRARFLLEIIDAMRAKMPADMPLFVRISSTEWLEESRPDLNPWTIEDSIRLVKLMVGKVDVVDVSTGGAHPDQKINMEPWSDTPAGIAYQAPFALKIKKAVGESILVNAVGSIKSGYAANELLDSGLDMVAVGRPFLKNPGTVLQFAEELGVDVEMAVQQSYVYRGRGYPGSKGRS